MNQGKSTTKKAKGFSDEERAAMKERAQELKAAAKKADGESAVLAKIAEVPGRRAGAGFPRLRRASPAQSGHCRQFLE